MASFNLRQDETGDMIGRPTDAQAQRRQRILAGLAGLLAMLEACLAASLFVGAAGTFVELKTEMSCVLMMETPQSEFVGRM